MIVRVLLLLFAFCVTAHADHFLETIPLTGNDCLSSIITLGPDKILATGVDFSANDALLFTANSSGTLSKVQRISGSAADEAQAITRTSDGGAVIVGSTTSFGAGLTDGFLMKIRANGSVAWKKTFGTSGNEHIVRVMEMADHSLVVLADADHDPNLNDIVVAKFNTTGGFVWRKVFSAGTFDHPSDMQRTNDNSIVIAIAADLPSGTRSVVAKIASNGTVQWARSYGSSGNHVALSVAPATDGTYYFTEIFTPTGTQIGKTVLSKLDSAGVPIWSRVYASSGASLNANVSVAANGNLLLAGNTTTSNGSNSHGVLIGLNQNGTALWRKRVSPDTRPVFLSKPALSSSDGSILIAGCTGDRSANNMDSLILNVAANGTIEGGCSKLISFPLSNASFNLSSAAFVLEEIPVPFLHGSPGFQIQTSAGTQSPVCAE
jgi:hypothetical protein